MQLPGEFSPFIEKKWFFAQWSRGLPPSPLLVVRPLKKTLFFMCVFPKEPLKEELHIQLKYYLTFQREENVQKLYFKFLLGLRAFAYLLFNFFPLGTMQLLEAIYATKVKDIYSIVNFAYAYFPALFVIFYGSTKLRQDAKTNLKMTHIKRFCSPFNRTLISKRHLTIFKTDINTTITTEDLAPARAQDRGLALHTHMTIGFKNMPIKISNFI